MQKYLIAGLLLAGMVSPAFAAEFYVAQSATTHKCAVTAKKPDGKSMMLISNETFKSKPDAMKAMKGMNECRA
jgi:hypothetical protein